MTTPELLPCPHCGSEAKFGHIDDAESDDFGGEFIQCTNIACAAATMLIFPTMADAKPLLIEKWNRRATLSTRVEGHVSFVIEKKSVLPGWGHEMSYSTEEQARAALPYWRKDTRKDLRIVRVHRQTLHVDSLDSAISHKG